MYLSELGRLYARVLMANSNFEYQTKDQIFFELFYDATDKVRGGGRGAHRRARGRVKVGAEGRGGGGMEGGGRDGDAQRQTSPTRSPLAPRPAPPRRGTHPLPPFPPPPPGSGETSHRSTTPWSEESLTSPCDAEPGTPTSVQT